MATQSTATERAVPPETNPSGDIPDNQVFVPYTSSAGGYRIQVPQGWARTDAGANVRFVDKLDGVAVTITSADAAPTIASARQNEAAALETAGRAVHLGKIQTVQLPAGTTVLIDYTSNSGPDPVTGKQIRLENNTYLFFKNGKEAALTLWAPQGADNVDQWRQMAESFQWQ